MSDVPTNEPAPAAPGTSRLRLVLLLLIFGLALAGLLYDRFVARPAVETAFNQVLNLLEDDERTDLSVSPDMVQQKIGRQPDSEEDLGNGKLEVYNWPSGVPFRKHSLFVSYQGKESPMLYSASKYRRPEQDQLPPKITPAIDMTPEELAEERMPIGAGAGAGGGQRSRGKETDGDEADEGDETKIGDATVEEDMTDEAAKEEPAKEEPKKEEPAKEPAKEEPAKEEPKKEEPAKEEPKKDEPKKEDGAKKDDGDGV